MNKETVMNLDLNPYFNDTIETNFVVWSHDKNSYRFNFNLFEYLKENPFYLVDGKPRILLKFLNSKNFAVHIYPIEIDDAMKGKAHFIIPDKILGYQGYVKASITVDFNDKTHDLGNFSFKMKKSDIDDIEIELEDYIKEFDIAKEEIDKIKNELENGTNEINDQLNKTKYELENEINKLNEQLILAKKDIDKELNESNAKVDELKDLIIQNDVYKKSYGEKLEKEVFDSRHSKGLDVTFNSLNGRLDNFDETFKKMNGHYVYLGNQKKNEGENDVRFINRIIKEMPKGVLVFESTKTYYINDSILINRSDITIDFNNSHLAFQGDLTNLIHVKDFNNVTLKNIQLTKINSTKGDFLKVENGTGFHLINVYGVNLGVQNLGTFFGVYKSFIKDVYVTNDNEKYKGHGFVFHYCVNWDVSNTMLSYFSVPYRFQSTKSPVNNFMNEGFSLRGIKSLKSSVALQIDMCTSLTVTDSMLDFNKSYGIYIANGTNIRINNFWIGLQENDISTGIEIYKGTALSFRNGTISGNWIAEKKQKAFFSNINTNATFEDIYLIDIHGGILTFENINVSNITYFQKKQKKVDVLKKGDYTTGFFGVRSVDNPLAVTEAIVDIMSVDSRNSDYYVISKGYVNKKGITKIVKIENAPGVDLKHEVYTDSFNIQLSGTFDPSFFNTIIKVSQRKYDYFLNEDI